MYLARFCSSDAVRDYAGKKVVMAIALFEIRRNTTGFSPHLIPNKDERGFGIIYFLFKASIGLPVGIKKKGPGWEERLRYTVCPWFFQPQPKSPWTFSLLLYIYTYNSSKSVEKTICHWASKTYFCKQDWKCHKNANFSIEILFFKDYSFGSPMSDSFLGWFWIALCITTL